MTQFLPANLLALFAARDPIPYLPPADKLPHEKKKRGYQGVGAFLDRFELPEETPPPTRVETREERAERKRRERAEQVAYKLEREIAIWDPGAGAGAGAGDGAGAGAGAHTGDAFKTLFVARINYDTSESKLRREFEGYGPIEKIVLVHDSLEGKPRGYAFVEYQHERDMHSAYKHADGKKIDGRRVLVDVERARTVKGWLPRRLGGGLGGTRRGGPEVNVKHSGREDNERERERYRVERERERDRDRDRREERPRRRSRERERDRDRDREEERPRRRSRSRSRSRERRRRRSPEEERRDRDRDRDRDRRKKKSRSRSRDRRRKRERRQEGRRDETSVKEERIKIKEEPADDYPDYSAQYATAAAPSLAGVKRESDEDEKKFRPDDSNGHYDDREDGEYDGY